MDKKDSLPSNAKLGPWGWVAIVVLVGLLGWALWYSVRAWNALQGVEISTAGWVALVLGVLFTFLVGAGLMALIFYSSRKNYDR